MSPKTKIVLMLIVLMVADVFIPVPIVGLILLYVIFQRPPWFTELVRDVYSDH